MAEWSPPPTRRKQQSRVGSLAKNTSGSIMVNGERSSGRGQDDSQPWTSTREGNYYGDGSHVKRRLVLEEAEEEVKREPGGGVVAKLMGLEPPVLPSKPVAMAVSAPASGGAQVRQLQELLRIREPFLLRELLMRDELEDKSKRAAAAAAASTLRERLAHLVKRKPAVELPSSSTPKLKTTRKVETGVVILSPRRTVGASSSRSAPSSPVKRGLTVEPAVKIVEPNSVGGGGGQRVCSSSSASSSSSAAPSSSPSRSSLAVDTSSSCSSSASPSCRELEVPTFGSGGGVEATHRRRFSLSRSSSEPTMQVGKKPSSLARLSENLSKRFGNKKPTPSPASEAKNLGGLHRSKSDLGLSSSSSASKPKKPAYSSSSSSTASSGGPSFNPVKEAMRSIFGHRRKSHQQQQPVQKKVEPSSSLVRSLLRKRNASPKPSSTIDPKPVAKKLEFEDIDQEQSPISHRSRTESGQPSPVSVLDAPFSDEANSSSSSSGDDSPEKPRQDVVDEAVGSDTILNAILDISRIRRIDLSSIGIEPLDQQPDDDLQCIEEVLSTSRSHYKNGDDWYSQGLPIVKTSSNQHLVDCVDEAIEARLFSLRLAMRMPWAGQRRLSPPRPSTVAKQVYDQISEWKSMATRPTDELVGRDMNVGPGRWSDWSDQVDDIGRDVARDILESLLDELVVVARCSIVNSTC